MVLSIADILNRWESIGVFDFMLPFLLIFAIVFGVLSSTHLLGRQKGVHVIIAIVVALLSLRLQFVQIFFSELFPRLGVGLAIIVSLVILIGLFVKKDEDKWVSYVFMGIGILIWIIALAGTFDAIGWWGNLGYSDDLVAMVVGFVLLIGLIVVVVMAKGGGGSEGRS